MLLVYRVRDTAQQYGHPVGHLAGWSLVTVVAMLLLVMVPLTIGSLNVANDQSLIREARPIAEDWAKRAGWDVTLVDAQRGTVVVTALGPPPEVKSEELRKELNAAGLSDANLVIRLVVGGTRVCPANGETCTTTAQSAVS